MPFEKKYDALYDVIKSCVERHQYQCVRLDKENFTHSIVEKMFDEIRRSKLMIFVATGKNTNTFYECGFGIALGKEVITLTDYYENLPFDIRDRNAIEYTDNLLMLKKTLNERLDRIVQSR
jgi:nucleoside 2-deoxyribosyltransferase